MARSIWHVPDRREWNSGDRDEIVTQWLAAPIACPPPGRCYILMHDEEPGLGEVRVVVASCDDPNAAERATKMLLHGHGTKRYFECSRWDHDELENRWVFLERDLFVIRECLKRMRADGASKGNLRPDCDVFFLWEFNDILGAMATEATSAMSVLHPPPSSRVYVIARWGGSCEPEEECVGYCDTPAVAARAATLLEGKFAYDYNVKFYVEPRSGLGDRWIFHEMGLASRDQAVAACKTRWTSGTLPSSHKDGQEVLFQVWFERIAALLGAADEADQLSSSFTEDDEALASSKPLSESQECIVQALREAARRLRGEPLLKRALGKANPHGKGLLADLVRRGVLVKGRDAKGEGYGLPEWEAGPPT